MGIKAQVLIEMDSQQFKTSIAFIIGAFDRFNQFSVYLLTNFITVKGTVSQDFLLLAFLMYQFPPATEFYIWTVSNFSKIRGDNRKSRCTTGINDTGGKFATGVCTLVSTALKKNYLSVRGGKGSRVTFPPCPVKMRKLYHPPPRGAQYTV